MIVELVCLANSWRRGGRCVAGVASENGAWRWIRPVGPGSRSALIPTEYTTASDHVPLPLDVLQIELGEPCPTPAQPENQHLGPSSWELLRVLTKDYGDLLLGTSELLSRTERTGGLLFGNSKSSVRPDELLVGDAAHSLTLVAPEEIAWEVRERSGRSNQLRAHFQLAGDRYDLPVTDPVWFSRFDECEFGMVPHNEADIPATAFLVVSLGELWQGCHYKIVASVLIQ